MQFDRDRSIRGKGVKRNYEEFTELFRPNLKGSNSRQRSTKPDKEAKVHKGAELQKGNGSNDGSGEPEEALKETKIPLKAVGEKVKDRAWLQRVRVSFAKKFYTASTLASKNTKRKKVTEILDGMNEAPFPLTTESITTIAAVLDATGMRAGDQYLAEAKAMHIEEGFDWDLRLDRQMSTCKRAMQRDKGPEQRAKEVRVTEIPDKTWNLVNKKEKEPKRVAWSYAWAAIWMFRAIEAAQISAQDVVVKVKHFIPKSKTDQRGMGTWRTLKCCGQAKCERSCPFAMAVDALNDLDSNEGTSPLFPDKEGKRVSKIHMVTAWAEVLDPEMTGHSARRSGAMAYARAGVSVHHIQFLGRWKSSAVFRYIEEAMTEIPLNVEPAEKEPEGKQIISDETIERKTLRPKAKGSPKRTAEVMETQPQPVKSIVDEEKGEEVYAISNTRGKWTKHVVGQAAWGIPLDKWFSLCGWNFAKRNVKVELTKKPSRLSVLCKSVRRSKWSATVSEELVNGRKKWHWVLDTS